MNAMSKRPTATVESYRELVALVFSSNPAQRPWVRAAAKLCLDGFTQAEKERFRSILLAECRQAYNDYTSPAHALPWREFHGYGIYPLATPISPFPHACNGCGKPYTFSTWKTLPYVGRQVIPAGEDEAKEPAYVLEHRNCPCGESTGKIFTLSHEFTLFGLNSTKSPDDQED